MGIATILGPGFASLLLAYLVVTSLYSWTLKTRPLVDIFTLAALYTMRLLAGGLATDVAVSIWLLTFSGFLFLALACVKRSGELMNLSEGGEVGRRGYRAADVGLLQTLGVASSFTAALVLALWVDSGAARGAYGSYEVLWAAVPLLLFWQCRLWLGTWRGEMVDDPIVYSARDWVTWVVFLLVLIVFLVAGSSFVVPNVG